MLIKKLVIGVRPAQKMFRVSSLGGVLVDNVLSLRGTKYIDNEYFLNVAQDLEKATIQLSNEEAGNLLQITHSDIIFTKDWYGQDNTTKNIESALDEYHTIWKKVNEVLLVKGIRRIGIVGEQQVECNDKVPSSALLGALTKSSASNHPTKFILRYEDRKNLSHKGVPDFRSDSFINVIREYYDSSQDAQHKSDNHFNANIDVQRFYSPLLEGGVYDEVAKLYKQFKEERKLFENDLKVRGLLV